MGRTTTERKKRPWYKVYARIQSYEKAVLLRRAIQIIHPCVPFLRILTQSIIWEMGDETMYVGSEVEVKRAWGQARKVGTY